MANCICNATLKHLRHDGNYLGDDWKYTITVNGQVKQLDGNGTDQEFGDTMKWEVPLGECGGGTVVSIQAKALEEDLFFDDEGSAIRHIKQDAPASGAAPIRLENVAVRARVVEAIGWFSGGTNFVDFVFDLEYVCAD